jgi:hypothetical protein
VSVGLYSGVSGLALGTGLYKNVSGLWGGASGLINGFGGGSPFGGASLYLDFLAGAPLDSRVTFTRGSNATLVDSTGKITYAPANLFTFSEQFDNAAWTKLAMTVTANTTVAPDGTSTADKLVATAVAGGHATYRAVTLSSGVSHTLSFYVKAAEYTKVYIVDVQNGKYNCTFDLAAGTAGTPGGSYTGKSASITNVGNGWYRCELSFTPTATEVTGPCVVGYPNTGATLNNFGASYTGDGTSGIYVWGAQLEPVTYQTTAGPYVATTSAAYYGPRFDYDPVTLAAKGLLIEEARTNLYLQSQTIDNASWVKSEVTVTANATTSPDGTSNAELLVPSVNAAAHQAYQSISLTNATAYTVTVYAKAGGYNFVNLRFGGGIASEAFFDISNGTVVSATTLANASIRPAGNGWYRCSYTATATSTTSFAVSINPCPTSSSYGVAGNGTSGVYVWGAQLEAGSFATSYIPTVASTVTRSADVATMTGTNFSSWYNQSEGTFVSDFDKYSTASRGGVLCAGNISGVSGTGITIDGQNNGKVRAFIENAGALVMDNLTLADYTANTPIKGAIAYATNNSVGAAAGALGTVDTSVAVPTVDNFQIGAVRNTTAAAVLPLNGHIRQIAYYNTRLPNTELQTLTAPQMITTLSLDFINGIYDA